MADRKDWEDLCRRCGQCCFEKIQFEGAVYYTPVPCPYLDLKERTCKVYPKRHQVKRDCAPLNPRILEAGLLPADCPYVAHLSDYRAPRLWTDEDD